MIARLLSFVAVALFSYHATMMHPSMEMDEASSDEALAHHTCADGELSDAARESVEALLAASHAGHDHHTGHDHHREADEHETGHDHEAMAKTCPDCAPAKSVALASAQTLVVRERVAFAHFVAVRTDRASPRQTTGPPVGRRAPPALFLNLV